MHQSNLKVAAILYRMQNVVSSGVKQTRIMKAIELHPKKIFLWYSQYIASHAGAAAPVAVTVFAHGSGKKLAVPSRMNLLDFFKTY